MNSTRAPTEIVLIPAVCGFRRLLLRLGGAKSSNPVPIRMFSVENAEHDVVHRRTQTVCLRQSSMSRDTCTSAVPQCNRRPWMTKERCLVLSCLVYLTCGLVLIQIVLCGALCYLVLVGDRQYLVSCFISSWFGHRPPFPHLALLLSCVLRCLVLSCPPTTPPEESAPEAAEATGEDEADLPPQAREHPPLQGGMYAI